MFSVCATGHRPKDLPWGYCESDPRCRELVRRLDALLLSLWEQGAREFVSGMALGVDQLFAEAAIRLRDSGHDCRVVAAVPCAGQASRWPEASRARWSDLCAACDEVVVLAPEYSPGCMTARNQWMVDRCDVVVAVFRPHGDRGGTADCLRRAHSAGRRVYRCDPFLL